MEGGERSEFEISLTCKMLTIRPMKREFPPFIAFKEVQDPKRFKITTIATCLLSNEKINGTEQKFNAASFRNKMSDRGV